MSTKKLNEGGLSLAVQAEVPRKASALSRGIVALPAATADVGLEVRILYLLHVRPVCLDRIVLVVEVGVDGRQGKPVELGGAPVAARPPLDL